MRRAYIPVRMGAMWEDGHSKQYLLNNDNNNKLWNMFFIIFLSLNISLLLTNSKHTSLLEHIHVINIQI